MRGSSVLVYGYALSLPSAFCWPRGRRRDQPGIMLRKVITILVTTARFSGRLKFPAVSTLR